MGTMASAKRCHPSKSESRPTGLSFRAAACLLFVCLFVCLFFRRSSQLKSPKLHQCSLKLFQICSVAPVVSCGSILSRGGQSVQP